MSEEYICIQDAIGAICSKCTVDKPTTCSTIIKGDNWCEEVHILLNLSPADVTPVVHGKWIKQYRGQVNSVCSVCGKEVGRLTNFCPDCGAKMDG